MTYLRNQKNTIIWFKDCGYKNSSLVGGKNASLGELSNISKHLDINTSDGFAITTLVYDTFITNNRLYEIIDSKLSNVDISDIESLNTISSYLQNLILNSDINENDKREIVDNYNLLKSRYNTDIQVAVRSSAIAEDLPNASFAGQQDTFLNVTNSSQLLSCIQKCYASLFNSRAISYRYTNKINIDQVKISVGIQKMVRSDLSSAGVGFSLDPNNGYNKAIIINSCFGLGELLVSGGIKPDEFIVDKRLLELNMDCILSKKLGEKNTKTVYNTEGDIIEIETSQIEKVQASMTDNQIIQLAQSIHKLENYYSQINNKSLSVDVEWAIDGIEKKLYIIQTRPETVHSNKKQSSLYNYSLNEKSIQLCSGISVGDKISRGKVKLLKNVDEYHLFNSGDILVTDMTTPDWEPIMKKSAGIITNKGGKTCHAAIVARELQVNACVGVENSTKILNSDQNVTIDCSNGDIGVVYDGLLSYKIDEVQIDTNKDIPVKLMLNVGSPENCFQSSLLPQKGVGLTRMEFIINNYIKIHPLTLLNYPNLPNKTLIQVKDIIQDMNPTDFFIYKLSHGLSQISSSFYPHDVIVRLSDFKSNEYKNLLGGELYEPDEENPMIGWRGASRYYSDEYLKAFELECNAIKYARENMKQDNIIIMIPFCRTPDECEKVINLMGKYGLIRGKNKLKIYLMCEIPSNVIEADLFSKYVDGVSIGGNDLLQLTLGIDRDSEKITYLSKHTNISYRRLIKQAIETYKKHGVKVGFCGQQPSDSNEFCDFLIESGIDSISVTPDSAIKTYSYLTKSFSVNRSF